MNLGSGGQYYMVLNMPDPTGAVRLLEENDIKKVAGYQKGVAIFNDALGELRGGKFYDQADKVTLVDLYSLLTKVNDNLEEYGLKGEAQNHGVPVNYAAFGDGHVERNKVTTSDKAHPTEKVYLLIASEVGERITAKFQIGKLKAPD